MNDTTTPTCLVCNQPAGGFYGMRLNAARVNGELDGRFYHNQCQNKYFDLINPLAAAAKAANKNTVAIVRFSDFNRGLKSAKRAGGTFNASDKTWSIPGGASELDAPERYGWVIVRREQIGTAPARCPYYTNDQGCPMHGETCR